MIKKFVIAKKKIEANELLSNITNGDPVGFNGSTTESPLFNSMEEAEIYLQNNYSSREKVSIFEISFLIEEK